MANAGYGRSGSAVPSANHVDLDMIDICSDSSSDKAARLEDSPSVDSDCLLSEESDAGSAVKGNRLLFISYLGVVRDVLGSMVVQAQSLHRQCRIRNLSVCLLTVCGCMHARGAHFKAKLYGTTRHMSVRTRARSRSSAVTTVLVLLQRQSSQPDRLKAHLRQHTCEKPFKCSECSYATHRASILHAQMRTHTGEMLFKCSECSYFLRCKPIFMVN